MNIQIATLCDFASIRDGMITIVSAGVTDISFPEFPASLDAWFAAMLEIPVAAVEGKTIRVPFELSLFWGSTSLIGTTSADIVGDVVPQTFGIPLRVPIAIPVRWMIPGPGKYTLHFSAGDAEDVEQEFVAAYARL